METVTPYLAFTALLFGTMTAVFTFTPKGFGSACRLYNYLDTHLWHKHLYARLDYLEKRLEEHESLENHRDLVI